MVHTQPNNSANCFLTSFVFLTGSMTLSSSDQRKTMVAHSRQELVHLLLNLVLLIGFTSLSSPKSRKSNGARSNQEVAFLFDVMIIDTSLATLRSASSVAMLEARSSMAEVPRWLKSYRRLSSSSTHGFQAMVDAAREGIISLIFKLGASRTSRRTTQR